MKKDKFKKLAKGFKKGFKETADFVGKYGPKVHAATRRMSETTMEAFAPNVPQRNQPLLHNVIPHRRKGYVDLTKKVKPKKVVKGKKGFYLDYTTK